VVGIALLIVGVDPGVTTSIALLDLKGNFIAVKSKKGFKKDAIIDFISRYGRPLIIAGDKKSPSTLVENLASSFNCELFCPSQDLRVKEKAELTKGFEVKNVHERDSLAAALNAFKHFSKQFTKIDSTLASLGLEMYSEKVKEMIVLKKARNINEAIEKLFGVKKEEKERKVKERREAKEDALKRKLEALKRSHEIAKEYIKKLEKRVKELEKQKRALIEESLKKSEKARREVLLNKEITFRDNLIKNLRIELEKERLARKELEKKLEIMEEEKIIELNGLVPVIPLKTFSREEIAEKQRYYRFFNSIVYFDSPCLGLSTAKHLLALRPKIVIGEFSSETKNLLENSGIIVIEKNDVELIKTFKQHLAINPEKLNSAISKQRKKGFLEWLKRYKTRFY
jgi:hypothetical protein